MDDPASTPGTPGGTPERPAVFFTEAAELDAWFAAHHATAPELWMGLHKKHVVDRGLTWEQAVPIALRWGWIDSVAQRIDDDSRRQRWTPRRKGSNWSKVNLALVEQFIAEGRMQPSGLAVYEQRTREPAGYTHERDGEPVLPEAYAAQLATDPAASAFWAVATPTYRRICITWVKSAKQETTRDRRMAQLVAESAAGQLIPSHRYGDTPKWVERAAAAAAATAQA